MDAEKIATSPGLQKVIAGAVIFIGIVGVGTYWHVSNRALHQAAPPTAFHVPAAIAHIKQQYEDLTTYHPRPTYKMKDIPDSGFVTPKPEPPVKVDQKLSEEIKRAYYAELFGTSSGGGSTKAAKSKKAQKPKASNSSSQQFLNSSGSAETSFNNAQAEPSVRDFPTMNNWIDSGTTMVQNYGSTGK